MHGREIMPVVVVPIPNHDGGDRTAMTDDADTSRLSELGEIMEQIKHEQSQSGWIAASDGALHQLAMKRLAERRLARRRSSRQLNAKSGSWFRGALRKAGSVYRHLQDETANGDGVVGRGANAIEAGGASQELAFVYSRRGSNYGMTYGGHDPATRAHSYHPNDGDNDSIGAALREIEGLGNIEKQSNPVVRRGSMASRRGSMQHRRGSLTSVDEGTAMNDGHGVDVALVPHSRRGSNDSMLSMESTSGSLNSRSPNDGLVCGWKPRRRHSITSMPSQRNITEDMSLSNGIGTNVDNAWDRPEEEEEETGPLESLDDSSVTYRATYRMVNGRPSRID